MNKAKILKSIVGNFQKTLLTKDFFAKLQSAVCICSGEFRAIFKHSLKSKMYRSKLSINYSLHSLLTKEESYPAIVLKICNKLSSHSAVFEDSDYFTTLSSVNKPYRVTINYSAYLKVL